MRDAMTSTFLHVLNGLWDEAINVACTRRGQHLEHAFKSPNGI